MGPAGDLGQLQACQGLWVVRTKAERIWLQCSLGSWFPGPLGGFLTQLSSAAPTTEAGTKQTLHTTLMNGSIK